MKNKGVIISILFILCMGVFVTVGTRRYVSGGTEHAAAPETYKGSMFPDSKKADAAAPQEAAGGMSEQLANGRMAAAPAGSGHPSLDGADSGSGADSGDGAESGAGAAKTAPSKAAAPALGSPQQEAAVAAAAPQAGASPRAEMDEVISPLTGSKSVGGNETHSYTQEDYERKLEELDARIQKMRDSGVEPNTDSYKNMAEYEYRIWDGELNLIYGDIIKAMTQEEADELRAEEREWLKQRDVTARKAISRYNGGTVESLEYTASLASTTRNRAYELLDTYGSYLNGEQITLIPDEAAETTR